MSNIKVLVLLAVTMLLGSTTACQKEPVPANNQLAQHLTTTSQSKEQEKPKLNIDPKAPATLNNAIAGAHQINAEVSPTVNRGEWQQQVMKEWTPGTSSKDEKGKVSKDVAEKLGRMACDCKKESDLTKKLACEKDINEKYQSVMTTLKPVALLPYFESWYKASFDKCK